MLRSFFLFVLLVLPTGVFAQDVKPAGKPKTVRLVTVGNSFSQNATRYLKDLVEAAGHTLVHRPLSIGGASLELHASKAEAFERDPKDEKGLYGKQSLTQVLAEGDWDFVTIQQASIKSHDLATYRPFAGKLHATIKKAAPKAEILIHQTWAYRSDDPRFTKPSDKPGEPATQKAMYDGLANAYETIAKELGIRIIPVGAALYLADTDPNWGYQLDKKFDFKNAKQPALPDEKNSLHTGYRWGKAKDGKIALGIDGHHANNAGQYLGACVFFEILYQESSVGNPFRPGGMDAATARYLQETAHKAVQQRAKTP